MAEVDVCLLTNPRTVYSVVTRNWVLPLLAVSDADIVRCGGFDALVGVQVGCATCWKHPPASAAAGLRCEAGDHRNLSWCPCNLR